MTLHFVKSHALPKVSEAHNPGLEKALPVLAKDGPVFLWSRFDAGL